MARAVLALERRDFYSQAYQARSLSHRQARTPLHRGTLTWSTTRPFSSHRPVIPRWEQPSLSWCCAGRISLATYRRSAFHRRQVTIGVRQPDIFNVTVCTEMPQIMVPAGVYDLDLMLRQAGFVEVPDLIVVWTSALGVNLPSNLSAFRCPKLLICSDTHHMRQPIRRLIDYARAEAFDAVASAYDRHHLHWFLAAGFANSAWLPGITVQHVFPPWQTQRTDQVVFLGQIGELHGWRGVCWSA